MRRGSFAYVAEAPATVAEAMALVGDLTRQGELHPLIVSIEERPALPGTVARYRITDRLHWGPVSFPITYDADVVERTSTEVVTIARQRPSTMVENRTRVAATTEGVRIVVSITLTAPTLLFGYAIRQAQVAHLELGARIARALGAVDEG